MPLNCKLLKGVCRSDFHHCDKIPEQNNFRKEGFILAQFQRLQSVMVGRAQWIRTAHVLGDRRQRGRMAILVGSFLPPILFHLGPRHTFRMGLSPSLSPFWKCLQGYTNRSALLISLGLLNPVKLTIKISYHRPSVVVHIYNPSYLGGRDRRVRSRQKLSRTSLKTKLAVAVHVIQAHDPSYSGGWGRRIVVQGQPGRG
jgi:hypothetical protein